MKIFRRIAAAFSMILISALAFSTMAVSAEPEKLTETGIALKSVSYASNFTTGYNFYHQLDANQKAIYDKLKNLKPTSGDIEINLATPITFYAATGNPTEEEMRTINYLVQGALDALLKDYPEIFWMEFGKGGCTYKSKMIQSPEGSKYRTTINSIVFQPVLIDSYNDSKNTIVSELQTEVKNFKIGGSSRYDRLRSIHDGLANKIAYDTEFTSDRANDAYGALVDGLAVCEGYSEAFKLLCDREGIPCILVVGQGVDSKTGKTEDHMWNAVQMEDGNWYLVDVTWDDQTEKESKKIVYSCFLVGTNSPGGVFGSLTFSQSHLVSGRFTTADHSIDFKYPQFSPIAYVPGGSSTKSENSTKATTSLKPKTSTTTKTTHSSTKASVISSGTSHKTESFTTGTSIATEASETYIAKQENVEESRGNNPFLSITGLIPFIVAGGAIIAIIMIAVFMARRKE